MTLFMLYQSKKNFEQIHEMEFQGDQRQKTPISTQ